MNTSQAISAIYVVFLQLIPLFRVMWVVTVVLGIAMLIIYLRLKKNPVRKKSPWIIGGIGLLMVISSGTQFIMSFFKGVFLW